MASARRPEAQKRQARHLCGNHGIGHSPGLREMRPSYGASGEKFGKDSKGGDVLGGAPAGRSAVAILNNHTVKFRCLFYIISILLNVFCRRSSHCFFEHCNKSSYRIIPKFPGSLLYSCPLCQSLNRND